MLLDNISLSHNVAPRASFVFFFLSLTDFVFSSPAQKNDNVAVSRRMQNSASTLEAVGSYHGSSVTVMKFSW